MQTDPSAVTAAFGAHAVPCEAEEVMAHFAGLADDDPAANLNFKDAQPRQPAKGARLRREWKGKTYEVTVCNDGCFEYNGEIYRSLSSVAEAITGTHWNGKRFFGVK